MNEDVSAASKAKMKYNEKAYDRLAIIVPKGKKEKIQACAAQMGKSLNAYVGEAIDEKMKQDGWG